MVGQVILAVFGFNERQHLRKDVEKQVPLLTTKEEAPLLAKPPSIQEVVTRPPSIAPKEAATQKEQMTDLVEGYTQYGSPSNLEMQRSSLLQQHAKEEARPAPLRIDPKPQVKPTSAETTATTTTTTFSPTSQQSAQPLLAGEEPQTKAVVSPMSPSSSAGFYNYDPLTHLPSSTLSSANAPRRERSTSTKAYQHPKRVASLQHPITVRALYSYEANAEDPSELSFEKGDIMTVIANDGRWWRAKRSGRDGNTLETGIIPSNYLVVLSGGVDA